MGRLPCLGDLLLLERPRQVAKKLRGSRRVFLLSHPLSKVRNLNLVLRPTIAERLQPLRSLLGRSGPTPLPDPDPPRVMITSPLSYLPATSIRSWAFSSSCSCRSVGTRLTPRPCSG